MSYPLEYRQEVGRKCKQLIDAGRLDFLRSGSWASAQSVLYVDPTVSGENRLLMASGPSS